MRLENFELKRLLNASEDLITTLRRKNKKQKGVIKAQEIELEERRMADVRAPCRAATPSTARSPPLTMRPRFRDRPRSSRPARSCVTRRPRPRRGRATSTSSRASLPALTSMRSSPGWPMSLTTTALQVVKGATQEKAGGAHDSLPLSRRRHSGAHDPPHA